MMRALRALAALLVALPSPLFAQYAALRAPRAVLPAVPAVLPPTTPRLPGASASAAPSLPNALAAAQAAPAPLAQAAALAAVPAGALVSPARADAAAAASRVLAEVPFAAAGAVEKAEEPVPAAPSRDYARMFDMTRRLLSRPEVRKFLREAFKEDLEVDEKTRAEYGLPDRIKEVSESQVMLLLQHNERRWPTVEKYLAAMAEDDAKKTPDAELHAEWKERFKELLADPKVRETFRKFNDPLTPMLLETSDGGAAYANARVYADHQTLEGGKTSPPADLKKVLVDFISGAEKSIVFNVFDFDLEEVADALIERAKAGVVVEGGIDKGVIESRPEVKAVFDRLNAQKGVTVRAVDSVGLNHQKMVMRDHEDPKKAKALFSSGNFTQSCIGPEGDLRSVPADKRPKDSVPNANHMLVADSYLLAQVAANSILKTVRLGLRGDEYPLGGAYKVLGEGEDAGGERPFIVLGFSPKGALGDINRDMIRRLILSTRGPLRLLQFAFSSEAVLEAVVERARLEKAEGRTLDLKSVGDTPFAVRPWSVFLKLAGFFLDEKLKTPVYKPEKDAPLLKLLGKAAFAALQAMVRVAPPAYRTHHYKDGDAPAVEYGAKLHHKVVLSGGYAVLGTSFNFSEAANHNQEQMLVTSDPALVAAMYAVFDGFFAMSPTPLAEELARRNEFLKDSGGKDDDLAVGGQYEHVDEEAGRSRGK